MGNYGGWVGRGLGNEQIRFLPSTEILSLVINLPVLFGAAGLEERFGSACLDR